jgi:hypothetical protein
MNLPENQAQIVFVVVDLDGNATIVTIKGITYRVVHNHEVVLDTNNFKQAVEKYNELDKTSYRS